MSEPFVGEIRMFAGNFPPRGWAYCDGQLIQVADNDALFSLLGTVYGGDGRTTFGLPDLRGRVPLHAGTGPGLTNRRLGAKAGNENTTLTVNQIPSHSHTLRASSDEADSKNPRRRIPGDSAEPAYAPGNSPASAMNASAMGNAGNNQPHTNVMPFVCVHFIIALFGIYPSRH